MNSECRWDKTFHLTGQMLVLALLESVFSNTGCFNTLYTACFQSFKLAECLFCPCGQLVARGKRPWLAASSSLSHGRIQIRFGQRTSGKKRKVMSSTEASTLIPFHSHHSLLSLSLLSLCKYSDWINWAQFYGIGRISGTWPWYSKGKNLKQNFKGGWGGNKI